MKRRTARCDAVSSDYLQFGSAFFAGKIVTSEIDVQLATPASPKYYNRKSEHSVMKREGVIFLAAGTLLVASCAKAPPPPPPATPKPKATPKPVPTPHPAQAATETAMRLYPDLANKDSTFNRAFREIYEKRLETDPASLAEVDWPLDIARRAGEMVGVLPQPLNPRPATPTPSTPFPQVATPRIATPAPNALERGAYNQKRGVAKPPVLVNDNGVRIPVR